MPGTARILLPSVMCTSSTLEMTQNTGILRSGGPGFWEVVLVGLAWAELAIGLALGYRIAQYYDVIEGQPLWLELPLELGLVALLFSLGFVIAARRQGFRMILRVFVWALAGGALGVAIGYGLIELVGLAEGTHSLIGDILGIIFSGLFLSLFWAIAPGFGFSLVLGVTFSLLRQFLPRLTLQQLFPLGIVGAIAGALGLFVAAGFSDWAGFNFMFDVIFVLLPAATFGAYVIDKSV